MSIVTTSKAGQLGTKRECRSCQARFYDLNKVPPTCPKCSAVFDVDAPPELPPLAPDEEDTGAEEKAKKKKKLRDPLDGASRGRFDSGDDGAADPDADW